MLSNAGHLLAAHGSAFLTLDFLFLTSDMWNMFGSMPRCGLIDLGIIAYLLDPDTPLSPAKMIEQATGVYFADLEKPATAQSMLDMTQASLKVCSAAGQWIREAGLETVAKLECELIPVLAGMEITGVLLDVDALNSLAAVVAEDISR